MFNYRPLAHACEACLILAGVVGLGAAAAQAQTNDATEPSSTAQPTGPAAEAVPVILPAAPGEAEYDQSVDEPARARPLRGLSIVTGLTLPLEGGRPGGNREGDRGPSGPVANLTFRYTPREGWFAVTTFSAYLKPSRRNPWNGDFTYAFGYDNWRPNTASLTYSNYGNNRFSPRDGDGVTNPLRGVVSLGYKINLPDRLAEPLLIDRSQKIGCRADYRYSARYERVSGRDGHHKQWLSAGCRYPVWRRAYVDVTANAYLVGEQRPWDADFTYGFGWFDWRSRRFSLQFNNYSGTRFPWRRQPKDTGKFRNGALSVSYNHAF